MNGLPNKKKKKLVQIVSICRRQIYCGSKLKFVCGRKENISNIATSLIVNDFAGWFIYRQIGIPVVILIRKTIAT